MVERDERFAQESYWQARYDTHDATVENIATAGAHDWYMDYSLEPSSPLRTILQSCAPATQFPRVVDLGCGDSTLCREMARDGYFTVGTDVAASAGDAQHALFAGVPPFVHCRTSALPFGTASCDVLIDKGTLDALLCGGDDRRARELLAEASRCVREGGWFFSVTYAASGHPSNMGPPTHAYLQID